MAAASQLLRLGYFKAPPVDEVIPYRIPPRTTMVELVTEGVIRFQTENGDMRLGCGALFWHVYGEETIHRTDASAPYECLAMTFSAPAREERPAPRLSIIADHQRARDLAGELLTAFHDENIQRDILGNYAYNRFLWEAHLSTVQRSTPMQPGSLKAALDFLERSYQRSEIGVTDLARAAGISEPHLHSVFRDHVGQSPHQYLIARRIREAKRVLTQSNATIKAVSTDCGFANIETFYRAFKRVVGVTPLHFRQSTSTSILEGT